MLPDAKIAALLETLRAGAGSIAPHPIPFCIAECNSYYHGGAPNVSDAYASALWVIDFLFTCAMGESAGVNLNGGGSGMGYAPIADSEGRIIEARPEYYGILLFALAGTGDVYPTTITGIGDANITAYAVGSSSKPTIVVINKDPLATLALTVAVPPSATSGTLLELTQLSPGAKAPDLSATSAITLGGTNIGIDGTFAPEQYGLSVRESKVTCYIRALSAVLVEIT